MPPQQCDEIRIKAVRSRLGQSLLRLNNTIEQLENAEQEAETMFMSWQRKWENQRELLTRRLKMIDSELQQFTEVHDEARPQLAIVGVPTDGENMVGMGPC